MLPGVGREPRGDAAPQGCSCPGSKQQVLPTVSGLGVPVQFGNLFFSVNRALNTAPRSCTAGTQACEGRTPEEGGAGERSRRAPAAGPTRSGVSAPRRRCPRPAPAAWPRPRLPRSQNFTSRRPLWRRPPRSDYISREALRPPPWLSPALPGFCRRRRARPDSTSRQHPRRGRVGGSRRSEGRGRRRRRGWGGRRLPGPAGAAASAMPLLVDGRRVRLPQSAGELVRAHQSLEVSGARRGGFGAGPRGAAGPGARREEPSSARRRHRHRRPSPDTELKVGAAGVFGVRPPTRFPLGTPRSSSFFRGHCPGPSVTEEGTGPEKIGDWTRVAQRRA